MKKNIIKQIKNEFIKNIYIYKKKSLIKGYEKFK